MDKSRQQLNDFRLLHPELSRVSGRKELSSVDAWDAGGKPASNAQKGLPQLPFLTPCVTEALQSCLDTDACQVVAEEADVSCARIARNSGAAVLTNDSDLSLYDLGAEGCVLWLRDLAVETNTDSSDSRLVCSTFRPTYTAQRIGLPSFLNFGFERSLDANTTTSTIQEREKTITSQAERRKEFQAFCKNFEVTPEPAQLLDLSSLDTRLCEFVVQASASSEQPQVYLPVLHEDPSRDSSWTYGFTARQVAYFLFYHLQNKRPAGSITEHARKGSRIAGTVFPVLSKVEIRAIITTLIEDLTISPSESLPCWCAVALITVLQQKLDAGKTPFTHAMVDTLFGVGAGAGVSCSTTWDDIHLLGNVHAVLYSWRMLSQILCWVLGVNNNQVARGDMQEHIEELKMRLDKTPMINELFLQADEMRKLPVGKRSQAAARVKEFLDARVDVSRQGEQVQQGRQRERKRKRRKVAGDVEPGVMGGNAFAALAEGTSDQSTDSE